MKGKVVSLAVVLMLVGSITAIPIRAMNDPNTLTYPISFSGIEIKEKEIKGMTFTEVLLPEVPTIGNPGEPMLPVKSVGILLPPAKDIAYIEVTPLSSIQIPINNYIAPAPEPVPIGYPAPKKLTINKEVYTSDEPYPREIYQNLGVQYARGFPILTLNIFPVQYIPAQNKIIFHQDITIKLHLKEGKVSSLYRGLGEDKEWIKNLIINPEIINSYHDVQPMSYPGGICDPADSYDYVIITSEALNETTGYEYNWSDLLQSKISKGLSATKVTVEQIDACPDYWNTTNPLFNDTQCHIREFIRDAYSDWGAKYFLLGGDWDGVDNHVPFRYLYDDQYEYMNIPSDYYYSHLDGNFNADEDNYWGENTDNIDLYSEVFVGRVPVGNAAEVSVFVKKTLEYEAYMDKDFLEEACMYGGNLGWAVTSAEYKEEIHHGSANWTGFYTYGFDDYNAANPGNEYNVTCVYYDWGASIPDDYKNRVNNDLVHITNHLGHGNHWIALEMDISELATLTNTKYFFVYSQACDSGSYDENAPDDCAVAFLLCNVTLEEHGIFAGVFNTRYGWGNSGSTNGSSQWLDRLFWDAFFNPSAGGSNELYWHLGAAFEYSKDMHAPYIGWDVHKFVQYDNHLFGDPEVMLHKPLVAEHNIGITSVDVNDHLPPNTNVTINVTLVNNGNNSYQEVWVRLRINGTEVDNQTIYNFTKNTYRQVTLHWVTPSSGWYVLTVNATIGVPPGIVENYTLDNEKSLDVVIGPDIAVMDITAPDYLGIGYAQPVKATIANLGVTDEPSITIQLIANNTVVNSTVISLNSGESTEVTFMWDGTTSGEGIYDVIIHAVPVAGESYLKNQNKSHTVEVFYPHGLLLLVDDDNDDEGEEPYEKWYINAIYKAHWVFDLWDIDDDGVPPASYMSNYSAVIWETGDTGDTFGWDYYPALDASERAAIQDYLTNYSGRLFISGQNIAQDAQNEGWTDWLATYFHANLSTTDTGVVDMEGVTGDPIGHNLSFIIASGDGANNQYSPDGIEATADAQTSFIYEGTSYEGAVHYRGIYSVVFFSFGFEAIYDFATRTTVMQRVLNWLVAEHDIAVLSLDVPDYAVPSTTIYVNATIFNGGINPESNILVNFTVDGVVMDSVVIPSLNPAQSTVVSFTWTPSAGVYTVGVEVQPVPGENITINNQLYKQVIVGPDIAITGYIIHYKGDVDYLFYGENHTITVMVKNMGVIDVSNVEIQLLENGSLVDSKVISLSAGESINIDLYWTPWTTGLRFVTLHAVPVADEYMVANNWLNTTVLVKKVPDMEIAPLSIVYSIEQGNIESTYINISNVGYGDLYYNITTKAPSIEEDFDSLFPPEGWEIKDLGDATGDSWQVTSYNAYSGTYSAYVPYGPSGIFQDEWLITPFITLPSDNPYISFYHMADWASWDTAPNHLMISLDGVTWTVIGDYYYDNGTLPEVWTEENISLASYAGMAVKFAWHYQSEYGEDWYIDEIKVGSDSGVIFEEGFEVFPPPGWERYDYGSSGDGWNTNDWHLYYDPTYGWVARVYYSPVENQDEWLVSPIIDCSGMQEVYLRFWHYWHTGFTPGAYGSVYLSLDGGATWSIEIANFTYPNDDIGYKEYNITQWAAGQSQVRIRWRYVAYNDWWWMLDNIEITGSANWIQCSPSSGIVSPFDYQNITVTFDARYLEVGTYNASIIVESNDPHSSLGNGGLTVTIPVTLNVTPLPHNIGIIDAEIPNVAYLYTATPINATIKNKGTNDESNILVELLIDNISIDSYTIPYLAAGATTTITFTWTPTSKGMHEVRIYAHPVAGENVTLDNNYTKLVEVRGRPAIWVSPTSFDFALLPGETVQDTLTIGNDIAATDNLTFYIALAGNYGGGWIEQWSHQWGDSGHSQHAQPIGDIDEDGINEIIMGGYASAGCHIYSYNASAGTYEEEYFWTYPGGWYDTPSGSCVIDLDDDGDLEFVTSWAYSGQDGIHAHDWDGSNLTELDYETIPGSYIVFDVYACDYDDDGDVEVIVANMPNNPGDPQVLAYAWNNTTNEFELELTWASGSANECPMVWSGDVDGDGLTEVVAALSYDYKVIALNYVNGSWIAETVYDGFALPPYGVGCADIDGDGVDEIAVGVADGTACYIFDWNGAGWDIVWQDSYPGEEEVIEAVAMGDADNDGDIEALFGTDIVHVISLTPAGYVEESTINITSGKLAGVVIGDTDNDGLNEVKANDIISGPGKEWIVEWMNGWLSVEPMNGTLGIGESMPLTVTVNTTGLSAGNYLAYIVVYSNDPFNPEIWVPVNLTVTQPLTADADGPYYGAPGVPIQFYGSATGGVPPYSFHWDFGDGNESYEQNPIHAYASEGNYTVTLTVTDSFGYTDQDITYTIIIPDLEPPTTWTTVTEAYNGFISSSSVITIHGEDNSGIFYIHYIVDGGAEQVGEQNSEIYIQFDTVGMHTLEYWGVDEVGNEETHHVEVYYVDATPPTTQITFNPPSTYEDGIHIITPTTQILFVSTDNTGVAATYYRITTEGNTTDWMVYTAPFTLDVGTYTIDYYSIDNLGNIETAKTASILVSQDLAPITTCYLEPPSPNGNNGWYTTDVTVSFEATDGDGIRTIYYRINEGEWNEYTMPFKLSQDGIYVIDYYSIDSIGMKESVKTIVVKIDKTAPSIDVKKPRNALYIFDREIMPFVKTIAIGKLTIEAKSQEVTSGIDTTIIKINNEIKETAGEEISYTWNEFAIGKQEISIVAYDKAGNKAVRTIDVVIFNFGL